MYSFRRLISNLLILSLVISTVPSCFADETAGTEGSHNCHHEHSCASNTTPAALNLDLSSTAASVAFSGGCQTTSVNIDVGGVAQTVNPGQMLTPAQAVAAYQMMHSGVQNILLGSDGSAVGGSMVIGDRLAGMLNSLVIPTGVSVINQAAGLSLLGNLTNSGSIYAVSNNPATATATANISALNILNNQTGLISSVLPTGLGLDLSQYSSILNLSLSAINNIINSGTIMSAGNLTMSAGGSIQNVMSGAAVPIMQAMNNLNMQAPDIVNQGNIIAQMASINMATSALANQGSIQAMLGNINMTSSTLVENITVNALSGVMQALNGSIDFRDSLYTGSGNVGIFGGDYFSKALSIYSGGGVVDLDAGKVTGRLSISAEAAHVKADTPTLVLGSNCLLGDPTYYNTGNIDIDGPIITGEDLAIVAGGNITATSTTASINTGGNNLLMIAGATIDDSGCVGCSSSGTLNGSPPSGGVVSGQSIDVDLNTPLGGNIDLSLSEVGTGGNYIIDTSNGAGAGGSVTLVALANGTGTGYINVYNPNAGSSINTAGVGADGGAVTIYAGTTDSSALAITIGDINTAGGDVTIANSQATGSLTLDSSGQIGSGAISQGSLGTGNIYANNIVTDGYAAFTAGDAGGNGGSVTLTSLGEIQVNAISANGGAGGDGINGIIGVNNGTGGVGGAGGNGGNITLQTDGAIITNGSITSIAGSAGSGGFGAAGDSLNSGGNGGNAGNGGNGGQLSLRGLILYVFADYNNSGGAGGSGGNAGGSGTGTSAGNGGDGGVGGSAGSMLIISAGGFISGTGGLLSSGGNGGDAGADGINGNNVTAAGNGGAGGNASSLIQIVSADSVRFNDGIVASGGNGGVGAASNGATAYGGSGGAGGLGAKVLISSALTAGAGSGLGQITLTGGVGGDAGAGGAVGGNGGDGGNGGVFNVLSGAEILADTISVTGGAGGSGQSGDSSGGNGGRGGDGGSILLSAVDTISGVSGNALGVLDASGGAAGLSAGINVPGASTAAGNGGDGGSGGSIVLTTLGGIDAGDIKANGGVGSNGSAALGGTCGSGGTGGGGGSIVINALDDVVTTEINAFGGAAGNGAFAGGGSTVPGNAGVGGNGGAVQATVFGSLEYSYMNAVGGAGGNGARSSGNGSVAATAGGNGGAGGAASLLATDGIEGFEVNVNGGTGGVGGENLAGNNGGDGGSGGAGGSISLLSGRDVGILNLYSSGGDGANGGDASGGFGDAGNGGSGGIGGLQIVTAERDINTVAVTSLGGVGGAGGFASGGNDGADGGSLLGGVVLQQATRNINIGNSGATGGVQAGSITFITAYGTSTPFLTRVLPTLNVYFIQAGDLDNTGVNIDGGLVWTLSDVSVVQNTTSGNLVVNDLTLNGTESLVATLNGGASLGTGGVFTTSANSLISGDGTNPPTGQDVLVLANANITNSGSGSTGLISGVNSSGSPGGQIVMVAGTTASLVAFTSYGTGTGIAPFLKTGTASVDGGAVSMTTGGNVNLETNSNLVFVQAIPAISAPSGTLAVVSLADVTASTIAVTTPGTNALPAGSMVLAAGGGINAGQLQALGAAGADGDSTFINGAAGSPGGVLAVNAGESIVLSGLAVGAGAGGTGFGSGNGNMGGIGGAANIVLLSSDSGDIQINGGSSANGGYGGNGDRGGRGGNAGTINLSGNEIIIDNVTMEGGQGGTGDSGFYGGGGGQGGYLQTLASAAVSIGDILVKGGAGGNTNNGTGGLGGVGGVVGIQAFLTVDLSSVLALGGGGGAGTAFGGSGNDGGAVEIGGTVISIASAGINVKGGDVGSASLNGLSGFGGYGGVIALEADRLKITGDITANAGANGTINNSGGGSISIKTDSSQDPLVVGGNGSVDSYIDGSITANGNGSGYAGAIGMDLAGGLSLVNASGIFATTGTGFGGQIEVTSEGPISVDGGSNIYANGEDAKVLIAVTNAASITIASGGVINADDVNGIVQFTALPFGSSLLSVENDGTISAGNIVGFNSGTSGTIKITGAGDINAGQYVNVGNLNLSTAQILPSYVVVDPFTGTFTLGNFSITQNSIGNVLQVSGVEPLPPTPGPVAPSGPSFGPAQYLAYLRFLAQLEQIIQSQSNMIYEQLGTRLPTDYTPIYIHENVRNNLPLQGNITVEQLAEARGAIFSAAAFSTSELENLSNAGIQFGPKSGGNFFDLNKGYVLFMPTSDIKVQTKEGLVSIPKGAIAWIMETGNDAAVYDLHDSMNNPVTVLVNGKEMALSPGKQVLLTRDSKAAFEALNPGSNIGTRNVSEKNMGMGIKAYIADFTISGGMTNVTVMRNLLKSDNPEHLKAAHKMLKNAAILSDLGGYKPPYKTK